MSNSYVDYNETCSIIASNLKYFMQVKNLTQQALSNLCEQNGAKISQPTLSNLLKGTQNCSLNVLVSLCNALDVSLTDLLTPVNTPMLLQPITSNNHALITNPHDKAFKGYLNHFHIYFHQTIRKNAELLKGELDFTPSSDHKTCIAELTLPTGDTFEKNGQTYNITKKYTGQLAISATLNAAYCSLYSEEIGELCFFTFRHFHLLNKTLKCVMANALTISSGSNRRPTVHRLCLSDHEIPKKLLPYIKGQLLLNGSEIIISAKKLEALKKDPCLSDKFITLLNNATQNERYYSISESKLVDQTIPDEELAKMICLLRTYSEAPRYNKISRRTDDTLYELLKDND